MSTKGTFTVSPIVKTLYKHLIPLLGISLYVDIILRFIDHMQCKGSTINHPGAGPVTIFMDGFFFGDPLIKIIFHSPIILVAMP